MVVPAVTRRIEVDGFGFLPDGSREIVRRYTITNKNNAMVKLITLGAGIQSITIPNKNDDMADVVLGFDNVIGYLRNRYIGRLVGRVQSSPSFTSHPKKSSDADSLGRSFDIVNWDSCILGEQVVMTHVSREGSGDYPGDLLVQVKYAWTDDERLNVELCATSTKPTPIDVGSHCFFNLAGHGMGSKELKNHIVTVNANKWTPLNIAELTPTGAIENVRKTIYDLRSATRLSSKRLFKVPGGGYNHNLCITNPSSIWSYRFHARMLHPTSGRYLEVYSNYPAMQLYTGNDLPDLAKANPPHINEQKIKETYIIKPQEKIIGKDGIPYKRSGCFALIPQGYPNTSKCDNFPSNILHPGKIYTHKITYKFGVVV